MIRQIARMLAGGPPLWLADGPQPHLGDEVGAVVQTSGTSGTARAVVLSRTALLAAAEAARARVGCYLTWHQALPSRYVAGLMVAVRSLIAGRPVPISGTDLGQLQPTGDGDAISLVPTQLHRAMTQPQLLDRLRAFDVVLLGGAPLPPELRARAEDAGVAVVESYGMSETCGGVLWDGRALPGVSVELREGRVALAGPTIFERYLGQPEATAQVLRDGWVLTRDRGRWDGDRLRILGRVDEVVISGGVNVDLAEVTAAAAQLEPETAVLAVSDPEWGQRVVLVAPGGDLEDWRAALAPLVPRTWLPRQLVVAPIPRTPGGKPDRGALRRLVHPR